MRSTAASSLDVWHLAQEFGTRPELDATFIQEDMPVERVIAVDSEPDFNMDSAISCKVARMIKVHSVPGLTRL